MEFKDNDHILGIWYIEDKKKNVLITVIKRNDKWLGEVRFRYYIDSKAFKSNDKKSFYSFTLSSHLSNEEIKTSMETIVKQIASVMVDPFIDYLEINGGTRDLLLVAPDKKWMHMKRVSKEELDAYK